jgi:hypothetical protein
LAPSVDFFLEHRKEFERIGKLAIAATLIPHENYDFFQPTAAPRWYETLFHLMVEGGQFEDNKLSVITFNYDRSLEAFFFQALQNLFGFKSDEAEDRLRKIQIVHLYGDLGENLRPVDLKRGYQPDLKGDQVEYAANRLKIVHEAQPGAEFEVAQDLLRDAAEVIFLGFGFHYVNLQRLSVGAAKSWRADHKLKPTRFLACRTGMGNGDIARVKQYLVKLPVDFAPSPDWYIGDFLSNTECLMPK